MNYVVNDFGSYKLHMIETDKFKTLAVKVVFRRPIVKDQITIRNVLSDLFMQSSNKYKTKRDLTIEAQNLYACEVSTSNNRLGNYITTTFHLNCLNDKYTEEGNFKKAVEFLSEIIFNPDVKNKKFNKDKIDIVKNNCCSTLNSLKEDSSNYSLIRMFEEFDGEAACSYRLAGYLEDLDNINESNLYEYYESMINSDLVDVFILGNFNREEIINIFRDTFKIRTLKKVRVPYILEEKSVKKKREFNEKIDNSQSKLSIACRCNELSEYERNYVLTLYNVILGGGCDSKLFKEVREKHSLCYTVYSVPNKLDNVLIIQAGIDKDNYEKTVKLIEENMEAMRKGNFNESDISIAREYYLTALEEVLESTDRIIDNYLMKELIGTDTIEMKRVMIGKVEKDEIIKVAKKIKLDTIFLLEGVKDERD